MKEISITPAVTALLLPTAKYLGTELRDHVASKVESFKEKRRAENIDIHISATREKISHFKSLKKESDNVNEFDQLEFFHDWLESIQDVSPDDLELSELWRTLLARAAIGEKISEETIAVLKALTPREASLISKFSGLYGQTISVHAPSMQLEERISISLSLEQKGLIRRDFTYLIAFGFFVYLALFGFIYFISSIQGSFLFDRGINTYIWIGLILSFPLSLGLYYHRLNLLRWRLTWKGRELINFVGRL